ncbi:hypothetical protein ACH5RR_003151 [Cinchona calisaya]|uniref:Uncharacterized protein n=1 Tax=Cinchona calisaya TaxID=153742 RepID=A0ABD3AU14_9GENT
MNSWVHLAQPITNGENSKIHGFPVEPYFAQVVSEPEKRSGFSHSLLIAQWVSKLFVSSSASSSPESEAFSSRSSTSYPRVISWRSGLLLILRRDRIRGPRLHSLWEASLPSVARPFRLDKMTPLFSGSALLGGGYRS